MAQLLERNAASRPTASRPYKHAALAVALAGSLTLLGGCLFDDDGGDGGSSTTAASSTASTGGSASSSSTSSSTGSTGSTLPVTLSQPLPLGCASEGGLTNRKDVVWCEPFESVDWWQKGYLGDASKTRPTAATADRMTNATIVSDGCLGGRCLKVDLKQYQSGGLSVHWPLKNANIAPEALYYRYYMKLSPSFYPDTCEANGTYADTGGKFPGPADPRVYPEEQCGNGGAYGDGINCWSMRTYFRNCKGRANAQFCSSPTATTRIGSYLYYYNQQGFANNGIWDSVEWGQGHYDNPFGSCATAKDVGGCGMGIGGQLENDRWYRVETYVKMNTPGQSDGIIRAWVDGVLSYQKTNMIFRIPGHDNLHVRTIWLNVYAGGLTGLCQAASVYLDQMVASLDAPPGPWQAPR